MKYHGEGYSVSDRINIVNAPEADVYLFPEDAEDMLAIDDASPEDGLPEGNWYGDEDDPDFEWYPEED